MWYTNVAASRVLDTPALDRSTFSPPGIVVELLVKNLNNFYATKHNSIITTLRLEVYRVTKKKLKWD